ncbi:MAG: DNA polymerase III subunit delta [Treponema sp.]|nr:DNA polymerase III subunit delta [Treponema sp.]
MTPKSPCLLFLGPELGEKQTALEELVKSLGPSAEKTVYYAGETPAGQMVSAMRNGSLFADNRLFIIKSAENFKKKDELDLLAAYMASPAHNTVLVLISVENSISKVLEKPPAVKRVFYELSDQKKSEWVKNFFNSEGMNLTSDGVLTILEMVENNTAALQRECARLIMFFKKGDEIGPAEAEKWLSHTREESVFTLFSRIAANDFERSLQSLRILLAAGTEPQTIFAGLLWCFRKLRSYINLKNQNITDEWEFKKIGIIAPQARRDYSSASRYYNYAGAEALISLTAEYDYKIRKSNTFPKHILMDEYLYKIHSEAAAGI